jgi:bacillithiol biosynthesis cysteine-adding enzyme BshC
MASILKRQAAAFGVQDVSREPLAQFERPNTLAVVAGQQPGLFGGPLYTLYKALSAIALARSISAASGRHVVPIFWVASDDHDFDEVRGTWLSDGSGDPIRLEVPARGGSGAASFWTLRLGADMEGLIDRVAAALPASEFRDGVVESLREAYAPGRSWTEAFARFMAGIVAPLGALVFDPSDSEAKAIASPVFEREIALAGRSSQAAIAAGKELERLGYHAQIARAGNELNFFWQEDAREPIRIEEDGSLRIGHSGRRLKPDALAAEVRAHPQKASPGVLLRPMMQDFLFPTAAYVGGPAEVAYWGQVHALYPLFEMPAPAVSPRAGATLFESKTERTLERFQIEWTSLAGDVETVIGRTLRAILPGDFPETFEREREAWRQSFERLEKKVVAFDPSLEKAVTTARGKLEHEGQNLERKLMQVWKRRQEESVQQIRRAGSQLFPNGSLQERVFSAVGFLARHGSDLVPRVMSSLGGPGSHVPVPLSGREP